MTPENGGQRQQPQGFSPEIISGEIMDPWIHAENVRYIAFYVSQTKSVILIIKGEIGHGRLFQLFPAEKQRIGVHPGGNR